MSLSLLEGRHKQSALGWVGDKDVWDNGVGGRSGQLIPNLAILIGYKFILPSNPLSHGMLTADQSISLSPFFLQMRPKVVE